jgi:hypothetical protein
MPDPFVNAQEYATFRELFSSPSDRSVAEMLAARLEIEPQRATEIVDTIMSVAPADAELGVCSLSMLHSLNFIGQPLYEGLTHILVRHISGNEKLRWALNIPPSSPISIKQIREFDLHKIGEACQETNSRLTFAECQQQSGFGHLQCQNMARFCQDLGIKLLDKNGSASVNLNPEKSPHRSEYYQTAADILHRKGVPFDEACRYLRDDARPQLDTAYDEPPAQLAPVGLSTLPRDEFERALHMLVDERGMSRSIAQTLLRPAALVTAQS